MPRCWPRRRHDRRNSLSRSFPAAWRADLRQAEILSMMARGMTNPNIAAGLYGSAQIIKSHINLIFAQTGSANRIAAIGTLLAGARQRCASSVSPRRLPELST
jgi:DNA-binding CsgD family transcriptional regulator